VGEFIGTFFLVLVIGLFRIHDKGDYNIIPVFQTKIQ